MTLGESHVFSPGERGPFDCYDACRDEFLYDEKENKIPNSSGLGLSGEVTALFHVELADGETLGPNTNLTGIYIEAYMRCGKNDTVKFEFDLMLGTRVVVPARIFTPTLVYPIIDPADVPDVVQPKIKVSFSIGKGSHVGYSSHPRRTLQANAEPNALSDSILIPKFADRAAFDSPNDALVTIPLLQTAGLDGTLIDAAPMGRREETAVPYAPGAQSFKVDNPSDIAPLVARVSWRLAL